MPPDPGDPPVTLRSPDPGLDRALDRAGANLADAPADGSGDAFLALPGMIAHGDLERARRALEFVDRHRRPDGRAPDGLAGSGPDTVTYARADATPFWTVALHEYWRQTADTAFLRARWDGARAAYEWGLRNDADRDGLVDNVSAGPSVLPEDPWGGAPRQDLHLAAIWVESLYATSEMAGALGATSDAREIAQTFERAWSTLERRYYDRGAGRYRIDVGSGAEADADGRPGERSEPVRTPWPATALAFTLLETDRAGPMLDALGSHRLATGWGLRTLDATDPRYDPADPVRGAAVPWLTGFAARALYAYHRSHAGHAALDALVRGLDAGGGRAPDRLSGARYETVPGAVSHHIPGSAALPLAVFRGLLGLHPDAPRNRLTFAPHLPADWDSVTIERYPIGGSWLDIRLRQTWPESDRMGRPVTPGEPRDARDPDDARAARLTAIISRSARGPAGRPGESGGPGPPLRVRFAPGLPPGSEVLDVTVDGRSAEFERRLEPDDVNVNVRFRVDAATEVVVRYRPGFAVVPPRPEVEPGAEPRGLRIVRHRREFDSGDHVLELEGRAGRRYTLDVLGPARPRGPRELRWTPVGPARYRATIDFPGPAGEYVARTLRFR